VKNKTNKVIITSDYTNAVAKERRYTHERRTSLANLLYVIPRNRIVVELETMVSGIQNMITERQRTKVRPCDSFCQKSTLSNLCVSVNVQ